MLTCQKAVICFLSDNRFYNVIYYAVLLNHTLIVSIKRGRSGLDS